MSPLWGRSRQGGCGGAPIKGKHLLFGVCMCVCVYAVSSVCARVCMSVCVLCVSMSVHVSVWVYAVSSVCVCSRVCVVWVCG